MLYRFVKIWARISLQFYAKRITISHPEREREAGPLLLASNHPNSFLDAMLLGEFMKEPVYYITRGDVFKKPRIRKLLESLNMIPIYRIRDGKEMMGLNDETFVKSVEVLRNKGILLIFVEGLCINQTELLRPLKKGAPRILQACWQQGIPARVLPVWLQYSSYNRFGKTIAIRFGDTFDQSILNGTADAATGMMKINAETEKQLLALSALPFAPHQLPQWARILLFVPAMLGAALHAPLYLPLQSKVEKLARANVHYDSLILAFLMFSYPIYLLLLCGILALLAGSIAWWGLLLLPLLAKAYLHWK